MSLLDQNLFTLNLAPNKDDPNVVDLVDPAGIAHYRKRRLIQPGLAYRMEVYDPMSESLLIAATAPSATSKHKTLELCNPTMIVELKYSGTLSFKWSFKWEEHEFEWKREECFMLRKPDPPVLVAVTKEPPGRIKTSIIQILDYNLNRFEIQDRKGLEIVLLTALLTFHDSNDTHHAPRDEGSATDTASPTNILGIGIRRKPSATSAPPQPPPKPAPKTGVDRIAEMQAVRGEYNEIYVEDEGSVADYAQYCSNLLQDDAMLFVTLRSAAADQVPKVLQVVEQTKRIRHKAGIAEEEELHQYVLYDTFSSPRIQKGPRRIVLDDDDKDKSKGKKYAPPKNLTVHLSKIPMPELQPKPSESEKPNRERKTEDTKKKDEKKGKEVKKGKEGKQASSSSPVATTSSSTTRPPVPNKLTRPSSSPHLRIYPHQSHPQQPSPSPSQLNNPSIYVAPPPRPPQQPQRFHTPLPLHLNSDFAPPPPPPRVSSYHEPPSIYGSHAPPLYPGQGQYPPNYSHVGTQPISPGGIAQPGHPHGTQWTAAGVVSGFMDILRR